MLPSGWQNNVLACFGLASVATATASLSSYPFDSVRRFAMLEQSTNSREAFKTLVSKNGIKGLYKGASSARFLGGALCLVAYDKLHQVYSKW